MSVIEVEVLKEKLERVKLSALCKTKIDNSIKDLYYNEEVNPANFLDNLDISNLINNKNKVYETESFKRDFAINLKKHINKEELDDILHNEELFDLFFEILLEKHRSEPQRWYFINIFLGGLKDFLFKLKYAPNTISLLKNCFNFENLCDIFNSHKEVDSELELCFNMAFKIKINKNECPDLFNTHCNFVYQELEEVMKQYN